MAGILSPVLNAARIMAAAVEVDIDRVIIRREIFTGIMPPTGPVPVVMLTVTLKEVVVEEAMQKPAETWAMVAVDMGREVFTGTTLPIGPVLPDMSIVTGEGVAASGVMRQDAVDGKLLFLF